MNICIYCGEPTKYKYPVCQKCWLTYEDPDRDYPPEEEED